MTLECVTWQWSLWVLCPAYIIPHIHHSQGTRANGIKLPLIAAHPISAIYYIVISPAGCLPLPFSIPVSHLIRYQILHHQPARSLQINLRGESCPQNGQSQDVTTAPTGLGKLLLIPGITEGWGERLTACWNPPDSHQYQPLTCETQTSPCPPSPGTALAGEQVPPERSNSFRNNSRVSKGGIMWVQQLLVKSWWNLIKSLKKNLIDLKLCRYFILLHGAFKPAERFSSFLLYLLKMKMGGNGDHQAPLHDVQASSQNPKSTQTEQAGPLSWPQR